MTLNTATSLPSSHAAGDVLRLDGFSPGALAASLARFGLRLQRVQAGRAIPGSHWGDSEAGLIGDRVLARGDTPLHSILHESSHYVCMPPARRAGLHTDAGGDYDEENAVCYLQILWAGELPGLGRDRMLADMDRWGYSFRLGSARAWFEDDARDARAWLIRYGIIGADRAILGRRQRP